MAVEAHHLLHTGGGTGGQRPQMLAHAGWAWTGDAAACYEAAPANAARQQSHRSPCYGGGSEAVAVARPSAAGQRQALQQPCVAAAPAAAAAGQLVIPGQYAAASDSGVTFGGAGAGAPARHEVVPTPRKRKRAADHFQPPAALRLAGAADVAAHFHKQLVDVDHLVLQHTTKMCSEITELQRRHARHVVAAVEAAAAKRLRAKDEEIERMGRLNWMLEERVKSLYVEAQVWRDVAQSNETAANTLRGELQQALDAQQQHTRCGGDTTGADDAESCCYGENDVAGGTGGVDSYKDDAKATGSCGRMCRMCGKGVPEVLLLPCRHLCVCAACAGTVVTCPACGCAKNGTVFVNFS